MLKIDNYNSQILDNISFELNSKNLIILGPNGAGKTTLAKVLSGIINNDSIKIDNINPSKTHGKLKTKMINYIPAKLEIFDSFITVEEFVLLGRFPYKKSYFDYSDNDRKIALNTLEFLKISHLYIQTFKPNVQ